MARSRVPDLPLEHVVHALRHALGTPAPTLDTTDLFVIAAWGLAGLFIALWRFSGLPRG